MSFLKKNGYNVFAYFFTENSLFIKKNLTNVVLGDGKLAAVDDGSSKPYSKWTAYHFKAYHNKLKAELCHRST